MLKYTQVDLLAIVYSYLVSTRLHTFQIGSHLLTPFLCECDITAQLLSSKTRLYVAMELLRPQLGRFLKLQDFQ